MTTATERMAPIVWALGLTQIIGYGTLYYSFGTLAPSMAADFGWPEEWVFGILSGSLLVGGLVAPISGRWADRFGAARLMVWGSLAAAASLVLCALAPEGISFILGLIAIEVTSTTVLYATAFAALAQASTKGAQRSITYLTLIAGFASTVFWPVTTWLHGFLDWREVYLVYAAVNVVVCVPAHFWLAQTQRRRAETMARPDAVPALVPVERQRTAFPLMLLGFALAGFVSSAITVHMVPMLAALGTGGAGVLATMLFGPSQVLSRLLNLQFGRGLSQPALAVIASVVLPVGLGVLLFTAPSMPGTVAFAILFGLGGGLSSIVSGTLSLALFGSAGYGQRLGAISSARLLASSIAPFAFSLVAASASTFIAVGLVALVAMIEAGAFVLLWVLYGQRSGLPSTATASETSG